MANSLNLEQMKCLADPTRIQIMELLHQKPHYPTQISKKLDKEKQKTYYHIKKLKEANLIEEERKENLSGGTATYYKPTNEQYQLNLNKETIEQTSSIKKEVKNFLNPLIQKNEIKGKIIVGSPDEHGPDQVRARDGHLSSEISQKIGKYGQKNSKTTYLDTEINAPEESNNILLLGGVLTNTVTRYFNKNLTINFSDEKFPYRELETPKNNYSKPTTGIIAKTRNPNNEENFIYLVAGIRNKGTQAATLAFKNLHEILTNYKEGEHYIVVKGLDLDGDGEIDDYEILEQKQ